MRMDSAPGPAPRRRSLGRAAALAGLALALLAGPASSETPPGRLFIQVWWDSPAIEMDPADDPGRLEVYIGDVFVGCAVAPSHMNYRKQLMLVPPAVGFIGSGDPAAVKVVLMGQLGALPGQHVKVTKLPDVS